MYMLCVSVCRWRRGRWMPGQKCCSTIVKNNNRKDNFSLTGCSSIFCLQQSVTVRYNITYSVLCSLSEHVINKESKLTCKRILQKERKKKYLEVLQQNERLPSLLLIIKRGGGLEIDVMTHERSRPAPFHYLVSHTRGSSAYLLIYQCLAAHTHVGW